MDPLLQVVIIIAVVAFLVLFFLPLVTGRKQPLHRNLTYLILVLGLLGLLQVFFV